ncbi:hypothetical protein SAMN06295967_102221 [Belliella buryatensis]|uniref:Transposase IS200-like domain-containing protein n=1 Tax=Belliella buryatensis TaxID=1500549 RepID=A0A239B986_9BACT|nr:transposase [Belliella buryatensis]SNS04496.1 hypothetical protein SAMN06295967_102221 [Belliella buryatensis]
MERYKNKYRVASARASWWDYSWAGAYFITICTQNRFHYFGEINHQKMVLSPVGVLADVFWHEIPKHAPNVELGSFVIMPNHMHGILVINPPKLSDLSKSGGGDVDGGVDGGVDDVETRHALSLQTEPQPQSRPSQPPQSEPNIGTKRFQNPGKNTVSSIVGSYKSAVTRHANRLGFEFGWQSRFHDHIIRNDAEYQQINDYIETNPIKWASDKFNTNER